jgi:large subunit ribosomal protein L30
MAGGPEADVAEVNKYSKQPLEGKTLKITWVKSAIGHQKSQKGTIRSLGFTHLNQTVELPDGPQVRGQIFKVKHLLEVEEAK